MEIARQSLQSRPSGRREAGYALLMVLFMMIVLIIGSGVAMQNLLTEGRRQRETEMIWRGQQYARAIRLYYLKTGHYPQTADDLKKGMPELHFLRYAAYKDPMNTQDSDGSWRFIYVNSAGQIIGSVRYATLQQMALMDLNGGKIPSPQQGAQVGQPGTPASALANQTSANPTSQNGQTTSTSSSGASQDSNSPDQSGISIQPGQNAGQSNLTGTATDANGQPINPLALPKPTGPVDGPVLGGFLTGVGSTVDKPSIKVYNGGKKYNAWEFIWNPIEDQARAAQQGLSPQGQVPGQPGQPVGIGAAGTIAPGNSSLALGSNGGENVPNPPPPDTGPPSAQGPQQ
ncbi:MAG TPA: hypothetical protein VNE63_05135 [Candidatus Acidoferrales bacterium]|nr:hypothetical protein [Candidatus Acidoferrales bacterium]